MIVLAILIASLALYCFYLIVDAGQKSDKERAKLGLGPKGQGR
jgi:nitrogen fixation-related uncharacterized protein